MNNMEIFDTLDQAIDLVELLEVTCAGMDAGEAPGMNIVLHEIESRLRNLWQGIETKDDTEGNTDGFTMAQIVELAKAVGVHYEDMFNAVSKVFDTDEKGVDTTDTL